VGDSAAPVERKVTDSTVLFLSRLDPKKGLEALLGAWPIIVAACPAAALVIAGDGRPRYRQALERRAEPFAATVRFTGFVTGVEKRRLLAEASVLVLPSRHENFGVAVIDGLAAGLPVVVSPGVGLAAFVRERKLGLVTDSRPSSLADAVIAVLADTALRTRCATEGPRAVAHTFGTAVVGLGLRRMYDAAVAAPRSVP
jgi:glycosyltransferase involved in cell wall biosynthesis